MCCTICHRALRWDHGEEPLTTQHPGKEFCCRPRHTSHIQSPYAHLLSAPYKAKISLKITFLRLLALILCSNCSNTFNKVFGVIDPSLLNYSLNLEVLLSLLNHFTDGLGISLTARYRPHLFALARAVLGMYNGCT